MPSASCANFSSSAVYGCRSGWPSRAGCSFQPCAPSYMCTDLWFCTWTSKRVLSGRFISRTKGRAAPGTLPLSMCPAQAMVSILCQASSPPLAATFFSTICAAVIPGVIPGAGSGALASAGSARQAARSESAVRIMMARLVSRRGGHRQPGLGELGVRQRLVDCDVLDGHLVRLPAAFDHGLQDARHLQPVFGLVVAVIDRHVAHPPVEPVGVAVDLPLQESGRVDPHVAHRAIFEGELEPVARMALDRLGPVERDLGALAGGIDQRPVEFRPVCRLAGLLRGERFDLVAPQEWPQLPA